MKTLILVDTQNDFLPGGGLTVPAGDEVVAARASRRPAWGLGPDAKDTNE